MARPAVCVATMAATVWVAAAAGGCLDREERPMNATRTDPQPNGDARDAAAGRTETATFAAGCFWGVEAAFRRIEGVVATTVGYTGGTVDRPTYEQVCTDRTGHAEAVRVEFDPGQVSYEELLDVFWQCHDPTQLNRQGPDVGRQYRSAIFVHTPAQQAAAAASKAQLAASGRFARPIVTEILPAPAFYAAEAYHQQHLEKQGRASCSRSVR